ncbi:unnamed protein product [Ectocarpus sp. CCAP 1310/34]|nr:unnamed protein product [Ectocarpus sp. CCAP 1310/34]
MPRELEDLLNECWSKLVEPGAWLSYDEQMVKSTARAMFALMRFNKTKPIKTGIKGWAICCPSGYCFVQSIDGGFSGDIKLRPHATCPLGRSARTVLYVLLEACPTFSDKIVGSGITVAMDNFFTGASLVRCLATRDIFAVGTLRGNRTGVDLAKHLWDKEGLKATERGDMLTARSDELVIVKWIDSQEVYLMSTKHVFEDEWAPLAYERRAANNNGEKVSSQQPLARKEYVKNMGGVDVADQRLSAHAHTHRPMTFF